MDLNNFFMSLRVTPEKRNWRFRVRFIFRSSVIRYKQDEKLSELECVMNYKTKLLIKIFPSSIKHVHGSRGDLLVHDIALNYTHYDQSFLQFKLKKITEYNFALVHPNHTLSCSSQTARMKENTHTNTYIYTNRPCNIIKTGYIVDPMSWYGPPLYERRRKICFCLV